MVVPPSPALGHLLRTARREHDFTRHQVAAKLGVPASWIAHYEKGEAAPSEAMLEAYVSLLGIDVTLLGAFARAEVAEYVQVHPLVHEILRRMTQYELRDDELADVLQFIEGIGESDRTPF